jgi:hypothetical protein
MVFFPQPGQEPFQLLDHDVARLGIAFEPAVVLEIAKRFNHETKA